MKENQREFTLSDEEFGVIEENMDYWYGISAPKEVWLEILSDPENIEFSIDYKKNGLDTMSREWLVDIVGRKVTGREWPSGKMSKKKSEEFFALLKEKAGDFGFKINWQKY